MSPVSLLYNVNSEAEGNIFVLFKYLKVCSSLFKFRMPLHRDPTHGKGRELLIYSLQITDLIF